VTTADAGSLPHIRIEAENEWAWCGDRRLELTHRAFAVLRHLVENPHRLITKDDLLTAVWRDAVVSEASLTSCIRDLRKQLGDSSSAPRYIQTVHRRGFRFIGPIASPVAAPPPPVGPASRLEGLTWATTPHVVGRDADLAMLAGRLERALGGRRQLVFVAGEPGIGKTTLVDSFVASISATRHILVAHGQCVEQYGAGEPYMPVLEALGRLGRGAGGEGFVQTLKRYAPTWLVQLPALMSDTDVEAVQRRAEGASRERMLRELVEGLEAISEAAPLVLIFEDLHWSDSSTIDLLAALARRREPARLCIVGTYRPADVALTAHPLRAMKQELQLHGHCEELALDFLTVTAVGEYQARRFPRHDFSDELTRLLHRTTDGNPLFLVNAVDDLIARGHIRAVDGIWTLDSPVAEIAIEPTPTLAQMVERHITRLSPDEQRMLELASVAGAEFAAAVAPAGGFDVHRAEQLCESLVQRGQFLRRAGTAAWSTGTVSGRYAFIHALYHHALYSRVSIARRVGLHLRIGECLESGYGPRASEIAGELAVHFEQGRDFERAARYRTQAGDHALRQHAYKEALEHATRGLDTLLAQPPSPARDHRELALQAMLGTALTATIGYGAPQVQRAYERARALCANTGETSRLLPVLLGLALSYMIRGAIPQAREALDALLGISEATGEPASIVGAHSLRGLSVFYGANFLECRAHLETALRSYDSRLHSPPRSTVFRLGHDPAVLSMSHLATAEWILGFPERAVRYVEGMLALAASLDHPFSMVYAWHFAAELYRGLRDFDAMQRCADDAAAGAQELGFAMYISGAAVLQGALLFEHGRGEDGLAEMRSGVRALVSRGNDLRAAGCLAWIADAEIRRGRPEQARADIAEAFERLALFDAHCWDAELHRLSGLAAQESEAEAHFLLAVGTARAQHAKSFELRAAMDLSRLWIRRGRAAAARDLLSHVYASFTEGFSIADLVDAKALLHQCERDDVM